jgi:N-acetylmuramoyl-L-alanine amidase CwlA
MEKSIPTDADLYQLVKKFIYKKYPTHSAYRSGLLVKEYKKRFILKHGNKSPYSGNSKGLTRWFKEKWVNQRGEIGYKYDGDIYRPTKRITKKTPKTFKELSKSDIKKAQKKKRNTGRVNKF